MNKEKTVKELVPELRFPEYSYNGAWQQKRVDEFATIFKGKGISKKDIISNGKTPCIRYGEIYTEYNEVINKAVSRTNLPKSDLFFSRSEDVVIPASGETKIDIATAACVMPEGIALGGDLNIIRHNQNGRFLSYLFNANMKLKIAKVAQGDTVVHLYPKQIGALNAAIPDADEQTKIADCLDSIDQLIEAHTNKLKTLESYKKGLMQQLFPTASQSVPALRFPEFQDGPEWEEFTIADIGKVIRGASPRPKGDPRYYGGNVPRLMGQDVTRDGKWVTPKIDYLTEEGAKLSRPCPAGTLTIICSGDVGIPSFLAVDACIHDGFLAIVDINEEIINKEFLYCLLTVLRGLFFDSATHGGVFTNLTTSILKEFKFKAPNLSEQRKIADFLSDTENLIRDSNDQLMHLKAHKKGLMQQLFPAMD